MLALTSTVGVSFLFGIFRFGLDGDFHLGAAFQSHWFALRIGERVFNPDFFVEVVRPLYRDFGFLRLARNQRLDDLFHGAGNSHCRLFFLFARHDSTPGLRASCLRRNTTRFAECFRQIELPARSALREWMKRCEHYNLLLDISALACFVAISSASRAT